MIQTSSYLYPLQDVEGFVCIGNGTTVGWGELTTFTVDVEGCVPDASVVSSVEQAGSKIILSPQRIAHIE